MTAPITWFQDLGRADTATVGGKGANLGEMAGAGLPVPPGFVVTAAAYLQAMDEGGVRDDLIALFDEARTHVDDLAALEQSAERLRALVRKAGVPPALREPVLAAYHQLGTDVRGGSPLIGHRRGCGRHVLRRDARDVCQRRR